MNLQLTAIQLDTIPSEVNFNVHKALRWARQAFEKGAGYVFFHEGLTADYSPQPLRDGRPLESWEVYAFSFVAKNYNGYIGLGLNEIWQGQPYISMVFIGPEGVIDVYRKTYLWPNSSQQHKADSFEDWLKSYIPYQQGFRQERGILGYGSGPVTIQVGELSIGCLICADGSQPEAWEIFKKKKPDLIFWQNNRCNVVSPGDAQAYARELKTPLVATNRCGFSYHHFQQGGTCMIADNGQVVSQANEKGEEEMISVNLSDLQLI